MEPLIIKEEPEESSTPGIIFDAENNKFLIWGNSLPEDVVAFYQPVFKWVEEYKKQPNAKTLFVIKPTYFNSSSFKAVLDILASLQEIVEQNFELKVEWQYLDSDEDTLMTGKEFQGLLKKTQFVFTTYHG